MREMAGNTWINHFKDMGDYGIIDTSDIVHIECIRYCFIQNSMEQHDTGTNIEQENAKMWISEGKPDVLYFQPETFLARNYKMSLNASLVAIERQYGQNPPVRDVSIEFEELVGHLIRQNNLAYPPTTRDDAI